MKKFVKSIVIALMIFLMTADPASAGNSGGYMTVEDCCMDIITPVYDAINQCIHSGQFKRKNTYTDNSVEYCMDEYGTVRRIAVRAGTDESPYAKYFYYDGDGSLIFSYFESSALGTQRMFIYGDRMIRWRVEAPDGKSFKYDMENTDEYRSQEKLVLEESGKWMDIVLPIQIIRPAPDAAPASKHSIFPGSFLSALKAKAREIVSYNVRTSWADYEHLTDMEYVDAFMLERVSDDPMRPENYVGIIYKNSVAISPPDIPMVSLRYYYCLMFRNLKVYPDGTWRMDMDNFTKPSHRVEIYPGNGHYFYYLGYNNLDELTDECIIPYLPGYSFSSESGSMP